MLFCLCVTTNLVDINKLNTLGQVSCFILVCCLGRDKQLSVKKHMLVQQLSFMLCGCLVMSTKVLNRVQHALTQNSWFQYYDYIARSTTYTRVVVWVESVYTTTSIPRAVLSQTSTCKCSKGYRSSVCVCVCVRVRVRVRVRVCASLPFTTRWLTTLLCKV